MRILIKKIISKCCSYYIVINTHLFNSKSFQASWVALSSDFCSNLSWTFLTWETLHSRQKRYINLSLNFFSAYSALDNRCLFSKCSNHDSHFFAGVKFWKIRFDWNQVFSRNKLAAKFSIHDSYWEICQYMWCSRTVIFFSKSLNHYSLFFSGVKFWKIRCEVSSNKLSLNLTVYDRYSWDCVRMTNFASHNRFKKISKLANKYGFWLLVFSSVTSSQIGGNA